MARGSLAFNRPPECGGVLCKGIDGHFFFRVYGHDHSFEDFEIAHDDLGVRIEADGLAAFYRIGEDRVLDHSPSVLGLKEVDETDLER